MSPEMKDTKQWLVCDVCTSFPSCSWSWCFFSPKRIYCISGVTGVNVPGQQYVWPPVSQNEGGLVCTSLFHSDREERQMNE